MVRDDHQCEYLEALELGQRAIVVKHSVPLLESLVFLLRESGERVGRGERGRGGETPKQFEILHNRQSTSRLGTRPT